MTLREKENPTAQAVALCAAQLRAQDYARYTLTLFSEPRQRPALWAIFALHHELGKIPSSVREPMMGRIRFQWWRDALVGIFAGETPHHHVLRTIDFALTQGFQLQQVDLEGLVDAHETAFLQNGVLPLSQIWQLAELRGLPLGKLVQQVTGPILNVEDITHLEVAYEMLSWLPELPRLWVHGKVDIDVEMNEITRGRLTENELIMHLRPAIETLLSRIQACIQAGRKRRDFWGMQVIFIRYATGLIKKKSYNIFDAKARYNPHMLALQLALCRLRQSVTFI